MAKNNSKPENENHTGKKEAAEPEKAGTATQNPSGAPEEEAAGVKKEASETKAESTAPAAPSFEEAFKAEHDRYLRLAAEYDNYRKRSQKEREALFADIRGETVLTMLPVYDNLERALRQETADTAFKKGVEMTMAQFKEILGKLGVLEIPAEGEAFDPRKHNAVMHVDDENFGKNTVAEEFEKGFMLGDKVIRCSMVKVAN